MRKLILAGLTVAAVAAFTLPAWAWTASASGTSDCDGTSFTVNVSDEPGTHTASITFAGDTQSKTVPAEGGNSVSFHFNSHDGGAWSYTGTWSESSEVENGGGALPAVTDCEQTPPTTSPPTTTTQPPDDEPKKDDEPKGTATSKTRKAPAPLIDEGPPELGIPPEDAKVPPEWKKKFTG